MLNTLQRKLTLIITLTSFFALLVAGIFFVGFDYVKFREAQVNELKILSEVLGKNSIAAIDFNDSTTGTEILSMLRGVPQIDNAALLTSSGEIFAIYSRDLIPNDWRPPESPASGYIFEEQFLSLRAEISDAGRQVGQIYLRADLSIEQERWNRYLMILLAMGILALIGSIIIGYKLQNTISRPISMLSEVATKVTNEKDYSVRVEKQGVDELRNLIVAFNDMLEKIEERSLERDLAEEKLKEHRDHLEELVSARTQALENSNKELEAFSYSVSHDLRAPLRSINGFCQILVEDYSHRLDDTGLDYLKRTQQSTKRMSAIIESLLQMAKISSQTFSPYNHNLSMLVADSVAKIIETDKDRDIEIKITPDLFCECDADILGIALDNLIDNAWKYTAKQKKPKIEFGVTTTDNGISAYYIKDNGIGFDMKYADTIFRAFKRLHADKDFPGSGIGLATVSRIIERHGGSIWVESEVGVGTTFYFTLNPSTSITTLHTGDEIISNINR